MPHSFLGSSSWPSRVFAHGRTFKDIRIWILKQSSITESIVMLPIQGPRASEWQSLSWNLDLQIPGSGFFPSGHPLLLGNYECPEQN